MTPAKTFRIQARNLFITYPRPKADVISFTKEDLLAFLKSKLHLKSAVIAEEKHENGATHFHALISSFFPFNIVNPRFLDFKGWHPNIQVCRNVEKSIDYLFKDDNCPLTLNFEKNSKKSDKLFLAATTSSHKDFIKLCLDSKISGAYCDMIWRTSNRVPAITFTAETPVEGEVLHPFLKRLTIVNNKLLFDQNFSSEAERDKLKLLGSISRDGISYVFGEKFDHNNGKSSIHIIGPKDTGKTTWAKKFMPKPILFVKHLDNLQDFIPNYHMSILFDDMSFKHLPRETQLDLVDRFNQSQIHLRYKVANIPSHILKVFTSNVPIFVDDAALLKRVTTVFLLSHEQSITVSNHKFFHDPLQLEWILDESGEK